MQQSGNYTSVKSYTNQMLRTVCSVGLLVLVAACGGGGGGGGVAGSETPPAQLGAALPAEGNFIAITQLSISLPESSRTGQVVVSRLGDTTGASSVKYRFVAVSASAETDYKGVDGTLNWADGENGDRSIGFLVESDLISEGEETFRIELFDVTGGQELGVNDSAVIAITDSPCGASIPASMSRNTVLSAPCYQLNGSVTVGSGAQLSISPGTTIIASADSSITFTGNSTLDSEGTSSLPVTIKGADNGSGVWNGLALQSNSALHRIKHTEIRNANNAVYLHAGALAAFNNNVLRDNSGAGLVLPMMDVDTIQTQNTFINTANGIEIIGSDIMAGQTVRLPAQSTHYVLSNGLIINGTLELAAGTDLRMGADAPILVLGNGAISALGTTEKPINISGVEPQHGYWNGIQYASATNTDNRFEHVTIAHGGGDPARAGNIIVDGLDTAITMKNCALNDSAGYGIVYDSLSFRVELAEVSFQGNRLGEQSL